jgi:hypothetical protein
VGGASHERYATPSLCTWIPLHNVPTSALPWRTARHHSYARLMTWRHRHRRMKARQMHTTYRIVRPGWRRVCHVQRSFRRQQCKIRKFQITFPDHLLRSPDHLDNLAFILRSKEYFLQKHVRNFQLGDNRRNSFVHMSFSVLFFI